MSETTVRTASASAKTSARKTTKEYGIVIGILAGFAADGTPLVAYEGKPAIAARTLVDIDEEHIGRSIALQFERGDQNCPLIMGLVKMPSVTRDSNDEAYPVSAHAVPMLAKVDDDEILLVAHRKITLQCGSASISLDANGNIEIRGKHVLSRASGQNRIKGSSVSLN